MVKVKFDYDAECDSLFVYDPNKKAKHSLDLKDLVLDLSKEKKVVGFEIFNASEFIANSLDGYTKSKIKDILTNLKECSVSLHSKKNIIHMRILLKSKDHEIKPVMNVVSAIEPSPALAFA